MSAHVTGAAMAGPGVAVYSQTAATMNFQNMRPPQNQGEEQRDGATLPAVDHVVNPTYTTNYPTLITPGV
ncbi:MAG: hypothetical protein HY975_04470 [Candidatus Kerfeldbacteria bacterium]|nr:hypothetical protein [Candidatus Kerfeldbacteria bacterium]